MIYIVIEDSGEYSESGYALIKAFTDKEAAECHAANLRNKRTQRDMEDLVRFRVEEVTL